MAEVQRPNEQTESEIAVGEALASMGAGAEIGKVVKAHIKRKVAAEARRFSDLNLPAAIRQAGKRDTYIATVNATVEDLEASLARRRKNIENAQAKLEGMEAIVNALRPYMEEQPGRTVGEAFACLVQDRQRGPS